MLLYNVYVDGSCKHNFGSRGIGGFAYVITGGSNQERVRTNSGQLRNKTSNQMELAAAIASLKDVARLVGEDGGCCDKSVVQIISDSKYVVDNWQKTLARWMAGKWKTKKGKPVANAEYWKLLIDLSQRHAFVSISWVRGHGDCKYNNLADKLAKEARNGKNIVPKK